MQRDLPYEMTADLRTVGQTDLDGSIDTEKKFFGAHYRIKPESDGARRLIGFNFSEAGSDASLCFWEYDEDFKQIEKTVCKIPVRQGFI